MFDGVHVSETARVLIDARALLERGWCQQAMAMAPGMLEVDPMDPSAYEFCVMGAVQRAVGSELKVSGRVLGALIRVIRPRGGIARWNDVSRRTKEQVLGAFDRAIARELNVP